MMSGDDATALRQQAREEQRRKNREQMPNLAALVDEIREKFPGAKLLWGKDLVTGIEIGKKEEPDPDKTFTIPKDYYPSRQVITTKRSKK